MTYSFAATLQTASAASARDRMLIVAGIALLSALLSNFAGEDPWRILLIHGDKDVPTPVLPGVYFGLALAAAIYLWATKNAFNVFVVFIMTVVAWIVAHRAAVVIYNDHDAMRQLIQAHASAQYSEAIDQFRSLLSGLLPADKIPDMPSPTVSQPLYPYTFAICGFFAGLIGSAITAFGVSIVSADFRSVENWLRTLAIGAAAGVLLQWTDVRILPALAISPLFFVWQPAVAASIVYGLAKSVAGAKGSAAVAKPS